MDVRGALGLSDEVRNGFTSIRVHFDVKGDAPDGEAARARRARPGPLGRLRHRHQRRPGRGHVLDARADRQDRGRRAGWSRSPRRSPQELARRAPEHDREATFPHAGVDALKRAGYFTAPIPAELGGLGVTSVHDVVVASSRLARGDASLAIGVNMHLVIVLNVVRRWQARRADAARRARRVACAGSSRDGAFVASAVSEFGQDLTRPRHDRDAHRQRLADRRAQGVLHRLAGRDRAEHRRDVTSTTAASSATATRRSRRTRPASRSTATGTRSACAPRAATR